MAIRSAAQLTTGYSPHFLVFGLEMRLPADLYYDLPPGESASATESVANLRQVLAQVHETVTANMESRQKRQKACYYRKAYGCRFNLGDLVWMINNKPDLLVNKFHDRWLGPFKVTKRCSDLVYKILNADSGKTKRVHFNLLKAASRKNVLDDIGQNAPARDTNEESSEEEVPFIDEVPTLPAVANAAVPAGTQNAVTAETAAPNQPAADHLAFQLQATNNSAVPMRRYNL